MLSNIQNHTNYTNLQATLSKHHYKFLGDAVEEYNQMQASTNNISLTKNGSYDSGITRESSCMNSTFNNYNGDDDDLSPGAPW